MTFNVMDFLQEYGNEFQDEGGFRGEVLPQMIEAGFLVSAGTDSKFYPVSNQKLASVVKSNADKYAATINKAKVYAAVRQTWFAEILGRETQPNWRDGKWEVVKRHIQIKIDENWVDTGDWALFKSQWIGDEAPLTGDMFGKKLWVHAVFKKHPDFDENFPNKYTTQYKDDKPVLDGNGKPKPTYIRVVAEVIGESRQEAETWYAEHVDAESNSDGDLSNKLLDLRPSELKNEFNDETWLECCKGILEDVKKGVGTFEGWEQIGITMSIIEEIKKLA